MKISFLCPSYNHARYIENFVRSVLAQTDLSWELIIVDDASTDDTWQVLQSFHDSRIKLMRHTVNRGMAASLNHAFQLSNGELVSWVASDDMLMPEFVELVKQIFMANPKAHACYSPLLPIDENDCVVGRPLLLPRTPKGVFAEIFLRWNVLFSPGMVFVRNAAKNLFPVPGQTIQHTDTYINLCLNAHDNVVFLSEPLVKYRTNKKSIACGLSACVPAVSYRENLETSLLMDKGLSLLLDNTVNAKRLIGDWLPSDYTETREVLMYLIARKIADESPIPAKRAWALGILAKLLEDEDTARQLYQDYNFTFATYMEMTAAEAVSDKQRKKIVLYRRRTMVLGIALIVMALISALLLVGAFCI